jgi:prepilin-type N-terminal cleavage/methylation domain-containing protein
MTAIVMQPAMRYQSACCQRGMTLVEIMISMVVGLILLAGIISIFSSNKQAYRVQESTNILNENARYALNQMQYHLRMGEHWGGVEAGSIDIEDTLAALSVVGSCGAATPTVSGTGFTGVDGAASTPVDCIDDDDYQPNTDVLIIRYGEPARIPSDDVEISDDIFLRVAIGRRAMIHQGTTLTSLPSDLYDATDPDPDQLANYRYRTVVYFIRPCASQDKGTAGVCDGADDTTPTLARLTLEGTDLVQEDVVAGVEQMQVTYGVLDESVSPPRIEYKTAAAITASNEWTEVSNVQVSLVIRGEQRDTTFKDNRDFDMYGGYNYTPVAADRSFRRKLFNFTVQIRNLTRA